MKKLTYFTAAAGALVLFSFNAAQAHEYQDGDLTIIHPWARPTAEGQNNAAVYLSITDDGPSADRLVSAETPVAAKTELHKTVEEGGVAKMIPEKAIEVNAGSVVEFKPGGYHIMLIGLKHRLEEGQMVPITLSFEKGGTVKVEAKIEKTSSEASEKSQASEKHM
jgi:periplasmic copper chaperone A